MKVKIDKIIILLISLSLLAALYTIYQRISVENQYKNAEIILDYSEMDKMAADSDYDLGWWLNKFKEFGAQSVAVPEETINLLIEEGQSLNAEIVSELVKNYNWQDNYNSKIVQYIKNGDIDSADVIITTKDKSLYDYLLSGLEERYTKELYNTYNYEDEYYIVLNGTMSDMYYSELERVINSEGKGVYETKKVVDSKLLNIGIGYDDEKINLVKGSGLEVILRPINYTSNNEKLADAYKAANEKYNLKPRLYILYGKSILGYPDNENVLQSYINEYNIAPVLIESSNQRENLEQDGLNKLVEKADYKAVRAFTLWDYIRARNKYYNYDGAQEIENTMFRAIIERNIRLIYFKPFFKESTNLEYLTDETEYERTFNTLKGRLKEHGIALGKANAMHSFQIGSKRLAIFVFGITLAAVMLFIRMFNIKNSYAKYLYLFALPASAVPFVLRGISEKGFALIAAVAFAGLSIYFFMCNINRIYKNSKPLSNLQVVIQSALTLTVSIGISLIGAVFLDAMLCDSKYFLEMDIFRGVKAAQILPFAVFLIVYIVYFLTKDNSSLKCAYDVTVKILNKEIKTYYVIIAGLIAVIGYIYISRTGHETNLQPTNLEMIFRNFLEYELFARPRSKEFLIAFPAMFAAAFSANKKWNFLTGIFMLLAAIGSSSVINTFSHLRTPIYLSLARTGIALGFGIIIGCIAIILLNVIYKLIVKLQERLQ